MLIHLPDLSEDDEDEDELEEEEEVMYAPGFDGER